MQDSTGTRSSRNLVGKLQRGRDIFRDERRLDQLTGDDEKTIAARATILVRLGNTYRQMARYQLSVDRFVALETMLLRAGIEHGLGFARVNQATSLMEMGSYEPALEVLDAGLAVGVYLGKQDKTVSALVIRTYLLEKLGRTDEASVVATVLIDDAQFSSEEEERAAKSVAFAVRARSAATSGDNELALASWDQVLSYPTADDARVEALLGKGASLEQLTRSDDAATAYREVLAIPAADEPLRDAQEEARQSLARLENDHAS